MCISIHNMQLLSLRKDMQLRLVRKEQQMRLCPKRVGSFGYSILASEEKASGK